jgi:hypothetical protein
MKRCVPVLMLLVGLFLYASSLAYAATFTCLACHSSMKGKVRTDKGAIIEVNIDEDRFSKSVHGTLGCQTCHKTFKENPHETPGGEADKHISDLVSRIAQKAAVDPVAYAACNDCHSDIYKAVLESVHGKNIVEKKQKDGALCLDCHGSPHYIMPGKKPMTAEQKLAIVDTCGRCHENEEIVKKYHFSPNLVERYKEHFHGRKLEIGHAGAPSCVDCHGAHSIKKWDDPASPVSWEKRVETCGKCHPGATKKFVTAVTHKPAGPIPHYGEKALIVLTIGVFIFIASHVFLDFFAEVRDRFLRKGKEDSHE